MKRIVSLLLALLLCFGAIPFFGIEASAATSSAVASAVSNRLPLVTYAMPLSGTSKVYSYSNSTLSNKTTGYYIESFKDQIVITQISSDGRAVCVTYPSSSSGTGYRSRWFATDDILGLAAVDIRSYTCSSGSTTYRMRSATAVTSYGSISKNDSCVMLGNHAVGGKTYYPTIYPISSGTYNKVSGVRNKLALGRYAPSNAMRDVTASFANKTITIKSVENGKYLCADSNASGTPLRANKDQAITWETFTVSSLTSDGWVGFKAHNGKWLSAMADTTDTPIGAKYDNLNSWECFRIFQKGNDYYIKAQINNKWLCVRVDTDQAPVQAYANGASTWERLSIQIVDKHFNSGSTQYAPYNGIDYTAVLKNAYSSGKISSTEFNNRTKLLNEAKKMVTVLWTAPVSFHTWKSGGGVYNSNKAMTYGNAPSAVSQFVKGYTYKGIPYAANAGYNNYNAERWLSLISEGGISKSKLEGTVTYLGKTRYNTTFRGVDCSGFVHKAYSTIGSYTFTDSNRLSCSGMRSSSYWKKINASDALPGDILLKSGHVMIYLGKTSNGKVAVFESVADGANGTSGCRYYEFSSVSSYGYYRFAQIAN